jgi:hypothetical protein
MIGDVELCNFCDGRIIWLLTTNDVRMPVDAEPDHERGNVIRQGDHAGVLGAGPAAGARAAGKALHLHHRLTCPFADRWARPAGATRKPARR